MTRRTPARCTFPSRRRRPRLYRTNDPGKSGQLNSQPNCALYCRESGVVPWTTLLKTGFAGKFRRMMSAEQACSAVHDETTASSALAPTSRSEHFRLHDPWIAMLALEPRKRQQRYARATSPFAQIRTATWKSKSCTADDSLITSNSS